MREKSGKKGHRREISKQLIKRKLMEDLYPILRQKEATSRLKMKSSLNVKFANTLQFLDYNQTEVLLLQKFQEKLVHELILPPILLESALEFLRIDANIYALIKKLVNMHQKMDDVNENQLIYMLKNLVSTAKVDVKSIVTLLLFYHFMCVNIQQYRTILKEFEVSKIYELACSLTYPKSELITSKILSAVLVIIVKYNETQKIFKVGGTVIKLRRLIEKYYHQRQDLRVDHDHARLTLFFSIKHVEALIKHNYNPYQLMSLVQDQISTIQKQDSNHISTPIAQIFKDEMLKLKKIVQSKIEQDYYHNFHSEEKIVQDHHNKDRIQLAIKKLKRRKSLNYIGSKILDKSQDESKISQDPKKDNVQEPQKNFKDVYDPSKKVKQFSRLSSETNLKKGRKLTKALQQSSMQVSITKKIDLKQEEDSSKGIVQSNHLSISKAQSSNPSLFKKLSNLYQITNSFDLAQYEKPTAKEKLEKKSKIEQIYKNFSNLNKIVREIPRKQLERQFQKFQMIQIGTKSQIKEMLHTQIINFSAGLQNGNYEISSILNNKGCLELQFIKIWLGYTYLITIKVEVETLIFILRVTMNGQNYNIVLSRGSNVLCQRYVTIWPTIRYLVNKKLYQYSIFKRYEGLLLIKKMSQACLIQLQSQVYQQKFGDISKQEIQQINICLDSVFKIILISRQYYSHLSSSKTIKINNEISFPYLLQFSKQDAPTMKLNLLTEVYLSIHERITLVTFFNGSFGKYFMIKVDILREKLINTIKNRKELQVSIIVVNLESSRIKAKDQIKIQWYDFQQDLILFEDFKAYAIKLCTNRAKNPHFAKRFLTFFNKRIVIKYHPIFSQECLFLPVPKKNIYRRVYKKTSNVSQFDKHFLRHRLETIESYCDDKAAIIRQIPLKHHQNIKIMRSKENYNSSQNILKQPQIVLKKRSKMKQNNGLEKKQIWRQQKRINDKQHLMVLNVIQQPINEEWTAEITMTNRKNESKHLIRLNHLDLFGIFQTQFLKGSGYTQYSQYQMQAMIRTQRNTMLIKLLNSASFYYNYQILKICLQNGGSFYRHNFRQQLKLEQERAKSRQNKNIISLKYHPILERFYLYCQLRIVKPIKVNGKFGFLTLKQNFVHEQSFWEIILQFPRRNTHYVYRLKEQNMTFYISDHRKKNVNESYSFSSLSYLHENLSIFMEQSQHEDVINYKSRILHLINSKQIKITQRQDSFFLMICHDEFEMRERIIHQYDPVTTSIYNVWVNKEAIQVDIQYECSQSEQLTSSVIESSFLNSFKKEVIGHIELGSAFRFYEMENKDINEEDFYLKRVCQFYFDFVKQQKLKFDKRYQEKNHS